jgi:hypothetical protein
MLTTYKGPDGHRSLPLGLISERKSDKQPSTLPRICYKLVAIDQTHLDQRVSKPISFWMQIS